MIIPQSIERAGFGVFPKIWGEEISMAKCFYLIDEKRKKEKERLERLRDPCGLGILQKAVLPDPALRHRVERLLKSLK